MIIRQAFMTITIFCCLSFYGQTPIIHDPYLKLEKFTKSEGLSDNYVLDFSQDKDGFLWIATQNGLNRYDGYRFTHYFYDPLDSLSLPGNLITCITGDDSGQLWIGTTQGLCKFNPESKEFKKLPNNDSITDFLSKAHIRQLLHDGEFLWIETDEGSLVKLNTITTKTIRYRHNPPSMVHTYFYHALFREESGNIWLGGRYMGIYRFDPANEAFTRLIEDPNDPRKKRDNDVAVYFEDSRKDFWVGGTDGLYKLDRETGIFTKILSVSTYSIVEHLNGELWIGTGAGIFRYYKLKNQFRQAFHDDNNEYSLVHNHITKLFVDKSKNIWIGTTDGISLYSPSKNKFTHIRHIPENPNTPVSNHVTAILEDRQHRIWIGTSDRGVECFDPQWQKQFHYGTNQKGIFRLVSDNISTLMEDTDGDIWIGLWSGRGFHIVNPDKLKNGHFQLHKSSLKADWYKDFLEDSRGNFWTGIWGAQGLYNFDKFHGQFRDDRYVLIYHAYNSPVYSLVHDGRYVWTAISNQSRFFCLDPAFSKFNTFGKDHYYSFEFNKINSIQSRGNGRICFETNEGNYLKVNTPASSFNKSFEECNSDNEDAFDQSLVEKLIGSKVLSYEVTSNGDNWVGTNKGLYLLAGKQVKRTYRYSVSSDSGLINDTVWSLSFHEPDELWIGTNRGICMLNLRSGKFKAFNEPQEAYLSSHLVSFVFEDLDGNIWAGTTDAGVNIITPETGLIKQFRSNPHDSSSFWGDEASCIFQDSKGNIWIGGNGLNKYVPEVKGFTHFTTENGLAGNDIGCILEDGNGFLWISAKSGISKMDSDHREFENFYLKDGLQDNEFSKAGCRLSNGLLLFGGKNGISVLNPDSLFINDHPPQISITGFNVLDIPVNFKLDQEEAIKLKYNQNYFSFEFTALDFSDPENNLYTYILEGFDRAWIPAGANNRIARYSNVSPGRYTLHIKAAGNDGSWNNAGISIPLIITPPFWKTTAFYILEILVIIFIIISVIRYREKKMADQNRVLTLEQKLLRSQMNPHFIFNSLSSIQSFIFENNALVAGSYLSKFADLIRSILHNSREEFITLEKEIKTLTNYLELQKLRYDHKFDYEIDVDPSIEADSISIPPMMAQPFIENAIEHGIKHLDDHGFIKISFTLLNETILFIVEDNGPGIRAAKKLNDEKAKEHKSLATIITRERIEILNKGRKKKLYYMDIRDLVDDAGKVTGTQVKFVIPYNKT